MSALAGGETASEIMAATTITEARESGVLPFAAMIEISVSVRG